MDDTVDNVPPSKAQFFSGEFMAAQYQRRYFYTHINRLMQLCYSEMVPNPNIRITPDHVPEFIQCINKLNEGTAFMQAVSNQISTEQGGESGQGAPYSY